MKSLVVFSISFLISLTATPLIMKIALKKGFFDKPGGDLKIHSEPIPRLGGIAIFIAFISGLVVSYFQLNLFSFTQVWGLIVAASMIFFTGLWDDFKGSNPYIRLFAQIGAGLVLFFSGYKIGFISQPTISMLLTVFYVVGAVNSMNLLDGIDGLATGISIIIGLGFLAGFILLGNVFGILIALIIIASLWGFFPYNFPNAFIFLGDSGSTFLGFILAFLAINLSNSGNALGFIASIIIMGVPIIDTAVAIGRRIINRKSIFQGDRSHTYDLLIAKGLDPKEAMFVLCSVGLVFLVTGLIIVNIIS